MSNRLVWIVVMIGLVLTLSTSGTWAQEKLGLELKVLGKKQFVVGEPIRIEMKLVNPSDKVVGIVKPDLQNEVWAGLVITGADKKPLRYTGGCVLSLKGPVSVIVPAKGSYKTEADIGRFYDGVSKPGKYKVYVLYPNAVYDAEDGKVKNQVRSNEAEFEVVPPNGKLDRRFSGKIQATLGYEGDLATWWLFTHKEGETTRLYTCRVYDKALARYTFAEIGATIDDVKVSCLVDSEGLPHILHTVDKEKGIWAYDRVSFGGGKEGDPLDLETAFGGPERNASGAKVIRVGLYRQQNNTNEVPKFIDDVKVTGMDRVKEGK